MPIHLQEDGTISSAVLYEMSAFGSIAVNFFSTKLEYVYPDVNDKAFESKLNQSSHPFSPMLLKSTMDYPYIAYKGIEPDNMTIGLINTSQKMPQLSINLGAWEFIDFISYYENLEKPQALAGMRHGDSTLNCEIMFLAMRSNKAHILSIRDYPWVSHDFKGIKNTIDGFKSNSTNSMAKNMHQLNVQICSKSVQL
jgi:hypothetical protein